MTGWLRVVLAAQLAFFALWGGRLLTSHRDVATVWLATEPVDPRDLLSGHYVALRYAIGDPQRIGCAVPIAADTVYVRLTPSDEEVTVHDTVVPLWHPAECRTDRPEMPRDEVWLTGRVDAGRILYGIERFYVPEDSPLREARSGTVIAKVAINDVGDPRVLDLVQRQQSASE